MTKFRIIEHGTKGLQPQWYVEKFRGTLFGKRWCICSPYFESLTSVNQYFDFLEHTQKLKAYKKIVFEKDI